MVIETNVTMSPLYDTASKIESYLRDNKWLWWNIRIWCIYSFKNN